MTVLDDLRNTGSNTPQVGAKAAACQIRTCCFERKARNQILCVKANKTDILINPEAMLILQMFVSKEEEIPNL